ncbi:MAG: TonB-dependent receptor [Methylomonas sp.]|jgi:iron complex outermembrane receptor protein|uniref:TonB-dependent siderophore receptor n=1 Tax=Methylomonas sp. TaxID=418 RepID=UPI0025E7FD50|nr:TonB-dependent receptor [Methylomonas sp.]MCK9609229.1 TonB-dependent receptor [Methylomonas sp.]
MQFSDTDRLTGLAIAALLLPTLSSAAEPASVGFDIPAQSLAGALTRFSAATGLQVLYDGDLAQNIGAPALKGNYSAEQALRKLLQGSGLNYRFSNGNTVTLEKAATVAPQSANTMPPVMVNGKVIYDPTDPYNTDYRRSDSFAATKTDTPIMETPMSIQVIPKQILKDQQAIRIKDALKNVSGVFWATDPMYEGFQLRGFQTDGTTTLYRNGLRIRRAQHEVVNLEQLEVLKGPAAAMYGRIEPGGLINVVTKKPLETRYYALEQQFGSYDMYRTTIDATGPINDDHSLLYRFDAAYQNNELFIDKMDQERVFVAPSLSWKPSDRTEINLNLEYQYDTRTSYTGIPVLGNRPVNVPVSRFYGFGTDNDTSVFEKVLVGLDWSHQFNDDWKIQHRFHFYNLDYQILNSSAIPGPVNPNTLTATRLVTFRPIDETDTVATSIDLTGKFELFGTRHQVLAGFDYFWEKAENKGFFRNPAPASHRPVVDVFNPVYGQVPSFAASDFNQFGTFTQSWYGTYFQDQITLFDKLHIMGGGRYDWATRGNGSSTASLEAARTNETEIKDEAFSPRVGVVYQPWPWLSLYGNYVESFGSANTALASTGKPLDAETAQQQEVGFKVELFDKKLLTTVAFYELTKQNIATADLTNPRFSVPTGEARSRGIEVDVSGQVTDGLSLIASYAYTDAVITKDNRGNQGHKLWNVPNNSGSLWAKYSVQESFLRGLNFGAGAYIVGEREGNNANDWQMPGYVRVDALIGYAWNVGQSKVTTQLNVNNLLDKTIYETSAFNGYLTQPGAPRNFMGSIRVEF